VDGNWIAHSILGDVEDYEEMELILRPKTQVGPKNAVNIAPVFKVELIMQIKEPKVRFQDVQNSKMGKMIQIDKLKQIQERKKMLDQMHIFQRFR
jgi:hypothetical protein